MTQYVGVDTVIEIGSGPAIIGQVQTARVTETVGAIEGRAFGSRNSDPVAGNHTATFEIEAQFDPADAGQLVIALSGKEDYVIKVGGDSSGNPTISFNALALEKDIPMSRDDELVTASFRLQVSGAVTYGTVAP